MELRDFFRDIDPEKFAATYRAIGPKAPGNSPQQFQATAQEVINAMPLAGKLLEANLEAERQNDEPMRYGTTMTILTLCTLYRMAESDMGYEWWFSRDYCRT